jgi:hypothetical protein
LKDISTLNFLGKKSKLYPDCSYPQPIKLAKLNIVHREAAILVLGIISGFKTEFKQLEP